jgi:hypothetical protein
MREYIVDIICAFIVWLVALVLVALLIGMWMPEIKY